MSLITTEAEARKQALPNALLERDTQWERLVRQMDEAFTAGDAGIAQAVLELMKLQRQESRNVTETAAKALYFATTEVEQLRLEGSEEVTARVAELESALVKTQYDASSEVNAAIQQGANNVQQLQEAADTVVNQLRLAIQTKDTELAETRENLQRCTQAYSDAIENANRLSMEINGRDHLLQNERVNRERTYKELIAVQSNLSDAERELSLAKTAFDVIRTDRDQLANAERTLTLKNSDNAILVQGLYEKIKSLNADKLELTTRVNDLTETLSSTRHSINTGNAILEQSREENASLRRDIATQDAKRNLEIEDEKSKLKIEYQVATNTLETSLLEANLQHTKALKENETLYKKILSEYLTEMEGLRKANTAAEEERRRITQAYTTDIDTQSRLARESREMADTLTNTTTQLSGEVLLLRQDNEVLREGLNQKQNEVTHVQAQLTTMASTTKQIQDQTAQVNEELRLANNEINTLKIQHDGQQTLLIREKATIESATIANNAKITELEKKLEELSKEEPQLAPTTLSTIVLEVSDDAQKKQIVVLEEQRDSLLQQLSLMQQQMTASNIQNNEYVTKISLLTQQGLTATSLQIEYDTKTTEKDEELRQLRLQLERLHLKPEKSELERMKERLTESDSVTKGLREAIDALLLHIASMERAINAARQQLVASDIERRHLLLTTNSPEKKGTLTIVSLFSSEVALLSHYKKLIQQESMFAGEYHVDVKINKMDATFHLLNRMYDERGARFLFGVLPGHTSCNHTYRTTHIDATDAKKHVISTRGHMDLAIRDKEQAVIRTVRFPFSVDVVAADTKPTYVFRNEHVAMYMKPAGTSTETGRPLLYLTMLLINV
jgi:hypothetical protein